MNPLERAYDLWTDATVNESEEWNHQYGDLVDWIRETMEKLERLPVLEQWYGKLGQTAVGTIIRGGQAEQGEEIS